MIGTIASGVGVLGFLIFIGGAVQLARDRGAGTSGVTAAPLIPRNQLLAAGADQLFSPFLMPPSPLAIHRVLHIAPSLSALQEYYAMHFGTSGAAFEQACVRSVFEPRYIETPLAIVRTALAALIRRADTLFDGSTAEHPKSPDVFPLTQATTALADFLYLLHSKNAAAQQMLDQLQQTCSADGFPAFT